MGTPSRIELRTDPDRPGLVTITLDRPEKLNALDVELHDELQAVLTRLETDVEARVVVLTGSGRAFSAGADLASRAPGRPINDIDRLARAHHGGRTCELLDRLPQVTIGVANGLAIGGAVVLLSACDLRLATDSAWFSIPEVELGLPMTWQALPRLMRELGPARTKELVLTCDRFTAEQALRWGFLNHVHPAEQIEEATLALADRLLAMDPLSLHTTTRACAALAEAMVPSTVSWSDAELMLLAYRNHAARAAQEGSALGDLSD